MFAKQGVSSSFFTVQSGHAMTAIAKVAEKYLC
jgi:hypothetical protein